jgi:predicted TIM-barrel fold metal-dependent hydrolase
MQNDRSYAGRIVDFRVRPPFRSFRTAFHRESALEKSDDELMEAFIGEMDAAGIALAVAMGRTVRRPDARAVDVVGGNVSNDDVEALLERYPGRFAGFGSVDVLDVESALREVDRCAERGFAGVAFFNPAQTTPLYDDDDSLLPIYERCAERGLVASITSSIMVGPDISYSMPIHIQRVALAFPELAIVVPHGAWPWTKEIIGVVLQGLLFESSRVYLAPDFYFSQLGLPGRQDFIEMANDAGGFGLDRRLLYASSYPALPLAQSIETLESTPFQNPDAQRRIFRDNAAGLLALE